MYYHITRLQKRNKIMKNFAEDRRRSDQHWNIEFTEFKFISLPPGPTFQVSWFRMKVFRRPMFNKYFLTSKYVSIKWLIIILFPLLNLFQ
jgi:hypothetical protein